MRLAETKLVYKRLDQKRKRRGDNKLISPRQSVAIPSISDKHRQGHTKTNVFHECDAGHRAATGRSGDKGIRGHDY